MRSIGGPTTPAGLARSAIDPKEILIVAFGIDPINGRAVVFNAFVQGCSDRFMQRRNVTVGEVSGSGEGMESGSPERFVRINIAHPGNKGLVQEQRFESAGLFAIDGRKRRSVKVGSNGSGPRWPVTSSRSSTQ